MSAPFRDLAHRVDTLPAPHLDVDDLVRLGERRLRLRRGATVLGAAAMVALAVLVATNLAPGDSRSTVPVSPIRPSGYQLMPETGDALPVDAGRYGLTPIGPSSGPLAVVDIPEGFTGSGALMYPADRVSGVADECCIVGYWTVAGVYEDPCTARTTTPAGTTVSDLAAVLAGQRTKSTKPVPITLDGYRGVYLELTAPPGLADLSTCKDGALAYWESEPGTRWFGASHYHPDKGLPIERIWIVDVGGSRVVLSVGTESGVDVEQAQPLIDIVESVAFVVP